MQDPDYAYGYGPKPHVSTAERRRQAERELAALQKKGQTASPVVIASPKIVTTFWGRSWCENLERYGDDYAYRLPRGRAYVRSGAVVDLQIEPGEVKARVNGSSHYTVTVRVKPLPVARWQACCRDCAGGINSLEELLGGRISGPAMQRLREQSAGLFPSPREIELACTCPERETMCKHVAAVLYGIGARLDTSPELLFRLRQVDVNELIGRPSMPAPASRPPEAPAPAATESKPEAAARSEKRPRKAKVGAPRESAAKKKGARAPKPAPKSRRHA